MTEREQDKERDAQMAQDFIETELRRIWPLKEPHDLLHTDTNMIANLMRKAWQAALGSGWIDAREKLPESYPVLVAHFNAREMDHYELATTKHMLYGWTKSLWKSIAAPPQPEEKDGK